MLNINANYREVQYIKDAKFGTILPIFAIKSGIRSQYLRFYVQENI